jgi:hypothetical protein
MSAQPERLYRLLPALYRQRDQLRGEPLRALLDVLEKELQALEADIEDTYANWFIQTCDTSRIPYIGHLAGIADMHPEEIVFPTQRRQVGNSIAYRRRKGTIATLERVLADGTGWAAAALEMGRQVSFSQDVEQARPTMGRTVDVRDLTALADPEGAFTTLAHLLEARRIDPALKRATDGLLAERQPGRRGKYNLPNVGIFFWRLRSYAMTGSAAHVVGPACGTKLLRYTFHPLGEDMQLFTRPEPPASISDRVQATNVPGPITRELLNADLQSYLRRYERLGYGIGPAATLAYGPGRSMEVRYEEARLSQLPGSDRQRLTVVATPAHPDKVVAVDLSGWETDAGIVALKSWARDGKQVAIDPQLGRLVWLDEERSPGVLRVNYSYGFSAEIGGGPYRRERIDREAGDRPANCVIPLARNTAIDTMAKALALWRRALKVNEANLDATIRILDSGVYDEELALELPPGAKLAIVAENGVRPALTGGKAGRIVVTGETGAGGEGAPRTEKVGAQLILNGLLLPAQLCVGRAAENGPLAGITGLRLAIEHCALIRAQGPGGSEKPDEHSGLLVILPTGDAETLRVTISQSITGPLRVPDSVAELTIRQSIIDGGEGWAICAPDDEDAAPAVDMAQVTVFGSVHARRLVALDSLLAGPRVTAPAQPRDIQFTYLPGEGAAPIFTSRRYGDPAYAQLSLDCPLAILGGASDGSEMGAFHDLYQLQAERNLAALLDEYLPMGLSAGVFYIT